MEREKAKACARESATTRVLKGKVAGGRIYGYDNVHPEEGGNSVRRINQSEAKVVRRIFTMAADGVGLLQIAKTLNAEGTPSPTGRGWASTGVREMLYRTLYRGELVWNQTRRVDQGGRSGVNVPNPPDAWVRQPAPDLPMVPSGISTSSPETVPCSRRLTGRCFAVSRQHQGGAHSGCILVLPNG